MRKTVQLFHDMLTKGVNQLWGDQNCEDRSFAPT